MKFLFSTIAAVLMAISVVGQTSFQRSYGGVYDELGYAVVPTFDNCYLVVGYTSSFGPGTAGGNIGSNLYMLKLDSLGNELWAQTYWGLEGDLGVDLVQSADSGFVVLGMHSSDTLVVMKTDPLGVMEWSLDVPNVWGRSIEPSSGGGYVVVATQDQLQPDDVVLIKVTASGGLEWLQVIPVFGDQDPFDVKQTSDGGYVITGEGGWGFVSNVFLMRTDSLGAMVWYEEYSTSAQDAGQELVVTDDHKFVIAGWRDNTMDLALLMQTDSLGNLLWEEEYTGYDGRPCNALHLIHTQDDGYLLSGWSRDTSFNQTGAFIWKTDALGNLQWSRLFPKTVQNDVWYITIANQAKETPDGGFVIVGNTLISWPTPDQQLFLIKTNDQGVVAALPDMTHTISTVVYPNPFNDQLTISNASPNSNYSIYNALGVFVAEGKLEQDQILGLERLARGSYYLTVHGSGTTQLRKLILKQ